MSQLMAHSGPEHRRRFVRSWRKLTFVRQRVDVIVTSRTPSVIAAKQATSVVPIVLQRQATQLAMALSSLARPGGNITGLSMQSPDLIGKRLELLRLVAAPDPLRS